MRENQSCQWTWKKRPTLSNISDNQGTQRELGALIKSEKKEKEKNLTNSSFLLDLFLQWVSSDVDTFSNEVEIN